MTYTRAGGYASHEDRMAAFRRWVPPSPARDDEIRRRYDAGEDPATIAHDFGLSLLRVKQIGKRWSPKGSLKLRPEQFAKQKRAVIDFTECVAYWEKLGYPPPHAFVAAARRLWVVLDQIASTIEGRR